MFDGSFSSKTTFSIKNFVYIFFNVIEALLTLHFNKEQKSIIEWYLYDKFLPTGEMLVLNDAETGKEIPTDTPDDIWELVQKYEKKDNK